MKTLTIIFLTTVLSQPLLFGQTFTDLYNNETVYLKEVPGYASMNDWTDLFSDYAVKSGGRNLGEIKSIVIAPDGSVFMSHKTTYAIWKFDRDGKLVKKFGKQGSGRGEFVMRASVEDILGGKYLYTTDVHGRMLFFDLDGNYVKSLKLNYMPLRTLALNHMKIAIFGHVPLGKGKVKNIISILDYETGKELIIWEGIHDPSFTEIKLPSGASMIAKLNTSYPSVTRFGISATSSGNLLIASNKDHCISEYSPEGKLIRSFHVDIEALKITDADIDRMYEAQLKTFDRFQKKIINERKLTAEELDQIKIEYKKQLDAKREEIKAGDPLPFYSTILTDPEDNILVFEFTREKDSNQFSVLALDRNGALIGVSKFESVDYELKFTSDNFILEDSHVIAVVKKKEAEGVPLRLLKFKPSN